MKGAYSAIYVVNIVFQSIFTLLWQMAIGFGAGWLLVRFAGAPGWVYVVTILAGLATGLVSMVRFILSAMTALDKIEKHNKQKDKEKKNEQ